MAVKESIKFAGLEVQFGLNAIDTENQITMFKVVVNPGAKMGMPHYHLAFDECIYGTKGITTYTVDGNVIELGVDDSLFIKRGQVHGFINLHNEPAEFLCAITPAVFGVEYFRDIAEVINASSPPDLVKAHAVLTKHGLVPVMG